MKNRTKLIVIAFFTMFGLLIGIQFKATIGGDFTSPYKNEIEAQELLDLKKSTEVMKVKINDFKEQVDIFEKEKAIDSIPLQKLKATVDEFKFLAGYSSAVGPGIIIVLESNIEENIAEIIDSRKYLISLTNELKVFGGEMLSINNYRIAGRTEITLAGNHININGIPIAPPYIVQAIGNATSLNRYIKQGTIIFELMAADGVSSNIKFSDAITIPPLSREKPIQFLNVVDE